MTRNSQLNFRPPTRPALASASGSDDGFAEWHEEIKKPEYRLRIWAMLAITCAFVGDEHKSNYYAELAEKEKAIIASRQNDKAGNPAVNNQER
jgi:hypothetical protein